ncbi:MAG: ABC transporter permease [Candidatus Thorarchaeota archaeon]
MTSAPRLRIRQILAIAKKDMRVYYAKGPTLIFGLLFPFFFFLSFVVGRNMNPTTLMLGLTAMVVFFSATAVGPVIFPTETRAYTLERLISMPVPLWCILLGDSVASVIFCLISSSVPLVLTIALLEMSVIQVGLTIVGIVLGSICFAFFGQLISAPPVDQTSTIMMIATMVKFPLIFISGIFIPLAVLPALFRIVTFLSPLTYVADFFWSSVAGVSFLHPSVNLAIIVGWTLLLVIVSFIGHRRTLEKRL